jgi:hypothetical protein
MSSAAWRSWEVAWRKSEGEQTANAGDDLRLTEENTGDFDTALDNGVDNGAKIRGPQELRQCAQENRETESGAYLRQHGRTEDVANDAVVGGHAHKEQ